MSVNSGRPWPILSSEPSAKRTAKSMPDRLPIWRKVLSTMALTTRRILQGGPDRTRYATLLASTQPPIFTRNAHGKNQGHWDNYNDEEVSATATRRKARAR